eukprot:scaffold45049_cov69-Phaeocystis_antarctica.AAC.1
MRWPRRDPRGAAAAREQATASAAQAATGWRRRRLAAGTRTARWFGRMRGSRAWRRAAATVLSVGAGAANSAKTARAEPRESSGN